MKRLFILITVPIVKEFRRFGGNFHNCYASYFIWTGASQRLVEASDRNGIICSLRFGEDHVCRRFNMLVRPLSRTDEVNGDERVPRIRFNMLVRPLSRTNEVIEDEHVSHIQSLQSLLTDDPYGRSETCAFSIHHQLPLCP